MSEERIHHLLQLAQLKLLLCSDPDQAEKLTAEIHGYKAKLFYKRRSTRYYRDRHNAFQRTGAGQ